MPHLGKIPRPRIRRKGVWPNPCLVCSAEARFRNFCAYCGEPIYIIDHRGTHYFIRGSTEQTLECRCGRPEQQNRAFKTTAEMARKAADGLARGLSPKRALREAGYPEHVFKKGSRGVTETIRAELLVIGRKYIKLGKEISPEDQEAMVRGKLVENVLRDRDSAVMSAKQLGADKRISMWQPDSQVGMVVLAPPNIPKVDHEVPWIETRFQKERRAMKLKSSEEESQEEEKNHEEPEAAEPEVWEEEEKKHDRE